jgi:heme/copper-type cytochrome/quinol oxidase subunit 2
MENAAPPILTTEMLQVLFIFAAISIIVWILYARTMAKTLELIHFDNRHLQPKNVWWLAVPFINIYFNFVCVRALSDSLTNEFYDRKIAEEENPGRQTGLSYAWFFLLSMFPYLPAFLKLTFSLLSMIYFVMHWVKIAHFKHLIESHNDFLEQKELQNNPS